MAITIINKNGERFPIVTSEGNTKNGIPTGGEIGQILVKNSNNDFDTKWENPINKQISNTNILDNHYFGPGMINQKGQDSYTGGYCFDRWKMPMQGTVTKVDNGIKVENDNFYQIIEYPERYSGKTMTLSAEYIGLGDAPQLIFGYTTTENSNQQYLSSSYFDNLGINSFTASLPDNLTSLGAYLAPSSYLRAKLELGEVSTLKNDPPPDPAIELTKCLRHMVVYHSNNAFVPIANGINTYYKTRSYFILNSSIPLRITPTLSYNDINLIQVYNGENKESISPNSISLASINSDRNKIILACDFDKDNTTIIKGTTIILNLTEGAELILDANL